jgi:16S rRNA (cytosine1402-N4)-methyltransferase
MDPTAGPSAAEWLAGASEKELRVCIRELGEERFAGRIAKRIVDVRRRHPIATTLELVAVIKQAVPAGRSRLDPATRTFQAIRLRVNSELEELADALERASEVVRIGGRIVVIAFHSLEDRIVKRYFRNLCRATGTPSPDTDARAFRLVTRKPLRPGEDETRRNPRARSARLRVVERIA